MYIYLTIAEMAVFWPVIIGIGWAVGFISGLFGVGGGFLITPLLLFIGIPTEVAVATGANQAVATSASAALTQWQRSNVDLKVGALMLAGGAVGAVFGVLLVSVLRSLGQIDFFIAVCYAVLLGTLGLLMVIEGSVAIRRSLGKNAGARRPSHVHYAWVHGLPFKMRFPRSKLYMSVIPPLILGVFVGILGAVMGVGGGFLLVPAMVYLLKMPTQVVIGTSLVQVAVVSALATMLHATQNHSVDIELAVLLIIGGVVGAQLGARAGAQIKSEQLRALLGIIVLAVGIRFALQLVLRPTDLYSLTVVPTGIQETIRQGRQVVAPRFTTPPQKPPTTPAR